MPESVMVHIPIDEAVGAGAYLLVYADRADGVVDYTAAVSSRIKVRPLCKDPLHLISRHLMGRHLQGVGRGGHLDGLHLEHAHTRFQDIATWVGAKVYGPVGIGTSTIAAKIYDAAGRISASTPAELPISFNTSPEPASDFAFDWQVGQWIRFSFTPSRSLTEKDGVPRD